MGRSCCALSFSGRHRISSHSKFGQSHGCSPYCGCSERLRQTIRTVASRTSKTRPKLHEPRGKTYVTAIQRKRTKQVYVLFLVKHIDGLGGLAHRGSVRPSCRRRRVSFLRVRPARWCPSRMASEIFGARKTQPKTRRRYSPLKSIVLCSGPFLKGCRAGPYSRHTYARMIALTIGVAISGPTPCETPRRTAA